MAQIFQAMLLGPVISMTGNKKLGNLYHRINQKDLVFMKELIEAGKVKPVIDRHYTLYELAEALRYYEERPARGKIVITVEHRERVDLITEDVKIILSSLWVALMLTYLFWRCTSDIQRRF